MKQLIHNGAITGRHSGKLLREAVCKELEQAEKVELDFQDITLFTQSAADEFIGRLTREKSELIDRIAFSHCQAEVQHMLEWAAENADSVIYRQNAFA
ncbi:MAG: STAS-like domain-containing protein [bacterium]